MGSQKAKGKAIGLVPTMGALHQGHLSLIQQCLNSGNIAICSLFVNPTQFNDPEDLERYPRTPGKDLDMLREAGCHAVFMPEVKEMYPEPDTRKFDFRGLDKVLDGAHRPGHFNGVGQIVSKLFMACEPDRAYFGKKDYQQLLIIKDLVKQMGIVTEIVGCETVRETDGLAMSSRNTLLSESERRAAAKIPHVMRTARSMFREGKDIKAITEFAQKALNGEPYKLDYFEIRGADTLQELKDGAKEKAMAFIACFVGKVRLIDNISL